jgi:hypothetical protein
VNILDDGLAVNALPFGAAAAGSLGALYDELGREFGRELGGTGTARGL